MTVTFEAYDEKAGEFRQIAAIHYDGKKLIGSGDPKTCEFVLNEPIIAKGGGREITAATPLEFLCGLC